MATVSIPLTQGKVAIVDEADAALVGQYRWTLLKGGGGNEYAATFPKIRPGKQTTVLMHRFILGLPKGQRVDHWDGNGLNNTRANLRKATSAQNSANKKRIRTNNTSGYKGVYWHKQARSWHAHIECQGRKRSLGYHRNPEDAARAYDKAARALFGEFANLNFPDA